MTSCSVRFLYFRVCYLESRNALELEVHVELSSSPYFFFCMTWSASLHDASRKRATTDHLYTLRKLISLYSVMKHETCLKLWKKI
jgi:hypothetical protein